MLVSFLVVLLVQGAKFLRPVPVLTGIPPDRNFVQPGSGQILPGLWHGPIGRLNP